MGVLQDMLRESCETLLSWVTWIVLFVVSSHDMELLELRDLCSIGYIARVFELLSVATDHDKSVW